METSVMQKDEYLLKYKRDLAEIEQRYCCVLDTSELKTYINNLDDEVEYYKVFNVDKIDVCISIGKPKVMHTKTFTEAERKDNPTYLSNIWDTIIRDISFSVNSYSDDDAVDSIEVSISDNGKIYKGIVLDQKCWQYPFCELIKSILLQIYKEKTGVDRNI
jgi:hypothetical protein